MTVSEFKPPSETYPDQDQTNRMFAAAIGLLFRGKSNNVLDVTLDANAASTTVTDARIGVNTVAICIPTTANASAIALPYRNVSSPVNGSMSLVHANDANADKTFKVILVG